MTRVGAITYWTIIGLLLVGFGMFTHLHGQATRNPYPFTAYQIDQTCIVVNEQSGSMVAVPVEAMESCQLYTPEPSHAR